MFVPTQSAPQVSLVQNAKTKGISMSVQFSDWFTATDLFGSRAERFYEDMEGYKDDDVRLQVAMLSWLNKAYVAGQQAIIRDRFDNKEFNAKLLEEIQDGLKRGSSAE